MTKDLQFLSGAVATNAEVDHLEPQAGEPGIPGKLLLQDPPKSSFHGNLECLGQCAYLACLADAANTIRVELDDIERIILK